MKKTTKEVISVRPQKENKWIIAALEKRRKKEGRSSLSNTVEVILIEALKP